MNLLLTLVDSPSWQALSQALTANNLAVVNNKQQLPAALPQNLLLQAPVSLQDLTDLLQQYNADVILFYSQPELAIAAEVERQGRGFELATGQWFEHTQQLMALHNTQRRRIKLFNLDQCLLHLQKAQAVLEKIHLSLALEHAQRPAETMQTLAVCQYFAQQQPLLQLNEVLYASSMPVSEHQLWQANVQVIFDQCQQERDSDKTQLITLKNEQVKLQSAVKNSRQIAADQENALNAKEQQLQQLTKQQAEAEQAHQANTKALNGKIEELSSENDLLLMQLHQVQEELEQNYLQQQARQSKALEQNVAEQQKKSADQGEALNTKDKQLAVQTRQLENVKAEAEKLQQALAEAKANSTDKRQLDDLKAENELLLLQLQNVQEELEQYYLRLKKADNKSNDITHKKIREREDGMQNQQLRCESASTNYQYSIMRQEQDKVKKSVLWKAAAPLQAPEKIIHQDDREQLQSDCVLLLTSEYFDVEWYLKNYPDVEKAGMNPTVHYLKYGAAEGRFPSPQFDGDWYLYQYPDVAESGINPLLHFIKYGQAESRQVSLKLFESNMLGGS